MIDSTPDVKWSSAWWMMWAFGIVFPLLAIVVAGYGLLSGHSFAIAAMRFEMWFVPVFGKAAFLMSIGYIGLAISAFAYGFCRNSRRFIGIYEYILAVGLLIAAFGIIGCNVSDLIG